jgi:hypothetical protein
MSLERIIARLVGQAESGEGGSPAFSPAEGRVLSLRLRAIVDGDAAEHGAAGTDVGPAADALKLAAYLDGGMTASERDAFEAELARSPARRDDLIAALAWIDEVAARQAMPPAHVAASAIALETPPAPAAAQRGAGFAGWIEWLLPRPRLAFATSALASIAIVAVGIDIAFHTNPQFRQVVQSQVSPRDMVSPGDGSNTSARVPPSHAKTDRPSAPVARLGDPIILTAETINALIAYRDDPSPARQKELLAALARAGSGPIPADRVRVIMLQPQLYERLTQRGTLPGWISARITVGGELVIAIAN